MKRKATCSCGALSLVAQGEPVTVSVCHCLECQRRKGSACGIAVFFAIGMTEVASISTVLSRIGDRGKPVEFHFCPSCRSTLFWEPDFRPGMTALALGCFEDKDGLEPTQRVFDHHRHPWVMVQTS
jgi:hypothetical protein